MHKYACRRKNKNQVRYPLRQEYESGSIKSEMESMLCESARFVREHQGNVRDVSIFGQESNSTAWKLAKVSPAGGVCGTDLVI